MFTKLKECLSKSGEIVAFQDEVDRTIRHLNLNIGSNTGFNPQIQIDVLDGRDWNPDLEGFVFFDASRQYRNGNEKFEFFMAKPSDLGKNAGSPELGVEIHRWQLLYTEYFALSLECFASTQNPMSEPVLRRIAIFTYGEQIQGVLSHLTPLTAPDQS